MKVLMERKALGVMESQRLLGSNTELDSAALSSPILLLVVILG